MTVTNAVKGNLSVVIGYVNLPGENTVTGILKPDPYVTVKAIGEMEQRTRLTKIVHNSYNPGWGQLLDFCYGDWIKLEFGVHDDDPATSDDVLIPVFTWPFVIKKFGRPYYYISSLTYSGPNGSLTYGYRIPTDI